MADVKKYVQKIGRRLGDAFSFESFDTEDELEFWTLACEHLSREDTPSYRAIVDWLDLIYHAPAHFVYVDGGDRAEGKLQLFRRIILPKNLKEMPRDAEGNVPRSVAEFEEQVNNLRPLIREASEMNDYGFSSFPVGKCYHIPLYKEGNFFGIYCVGPYVENPESLTPRLPIVSRILSIWLSQQYEEEHAKRAPVKEEVETDYGKLSTGSLNFEGYGQILLNYLMVAEGIKIASLIEVDNPTRIIAESNMKDSDIFKRTINQLEFDDPTAQDIPSIIKEALLKNDFSPKYIHIKKLDTDKSSIFLLVGSSIEEYSTQFLQSRSYKMAHRMLSTLAEYRDYGFDLAQQLIDTYYYMLRDFERQSEHHRYHSSRMVSLAQIFANFYGINDQEKEILFQTAKLHDVGYLSIDQLVEKKTMGSEIEHPLLGELLVKHLPISQEVVDGIKTHHEWIDGSGTPHQLEGSEIPWTGKIIGLLEYIVEFIEAHKNDESKTDSEWTEELVSQLIDRTDVQFDMVLIPTTIEMIKEIGWTSLCKMGEDHDE